MISAPARAVAVIAVASHRARNPPRLLSPAAPRAMQLLHTAAAVASAAAAPGTFPPPPACLMLASPAAISPSRSPLAAEPDSSSALCSRHAAAVRTATGYTAAVAVAGPTAAARACGDAGAAGIALLAATASSRPLALEKADISRLLWSGNLYAMATTGGSSSSRAAAAAAGGAVGEGAAGGGGGGSLVEKRCLPCEGKNVKAATKEEIDELLTQVPAWQLVEVEGVPRLQRKWKLKNFLAGLDLFKLVADVAEAEGHHPDLHLEGWNNARIEIFTHSIGGLHANDFILAAKIDSLDVTHLVRVPKKKATLADA